MWWAHVLSQGDHRLNQVQPWAARRLETQRTCTGQPVTELDTPRRTLGLHGPPRAAGMRAVQARR